MRRGQLLGPRINRKNADTSDNPEMARNVTTDRFKLSCHTRTNKQAAVKVRRNKRTRNMMANSFFANASMSVFLADNHVPACDTGGETPRRPALS